jgi:hypothetical protein
MTTKKTWHLIVRNQIFLKTVYIPRKLNTMDKLSHLKMSGNYCISQRTFQFKHETSCIRGILLQNFLDGKKIEKPLYLEEKKLEELEKIPERWMLVLEILTHFTGLVEFIQRNYKRGWNQFISFFIKDNEQFQNWNNEDECIVIFGDFIS